MSSVIVKVNGHSRNGQQQASRVFTVEDYLRIQEERRELERKARQLAKEEKAMEREMMELVELMGPYEECGFRVSIGEKPGRVAWKQEFVKRLGEAEAARVQAECPTHKVLKLEQVS